MRSFTQQERHQMLVELVDHRIGLDMLNLHHSLFLFGRPPLSREEQGIAEDHYHSRAYDNLSNLDDGRLYEAYLEMKLRRDRPAGTATPEEDNE